MTSLRNEKGTPPNRKQAAFKIAGMFRGFKARKRVKALIRIQYAKKYDVETDKFYYENTKTGETSQQKPVNLGSDDLPNPKMGKDWKCAFCENNNRGLQPACRVCKRKKEDSLKRVELAEKERIRKEQEEIEKMEAEKAAAKAEEMERRKKRAAIKIPFAPLGAGARATKKGAVVWWTPGSDGGKPVTKWVIRKHRLDLGEWSVKSEIEVEHTEGFDCTYRFDEGLMQDREYRFDIYAVNEDGRSEKESNPTNKIEPGLVLPEGWEKNVDKAGRAYYFNRSLNKTSWAVPKPDKYYISPDLRIRFKPGEVDELQRQFNAYDMDGSGEIDKNELGQLFKRMGERIKPEELDDLLAKVDDDGSGEVSFQEFIQMIEWLREGRLSVGKKFMRGLSKLKGFGSKFLKKAFKKKKMSDQEKTARKMGDWQQEFNKNIGKPYYFNRKTGETTWKRPQEVLFWMSPALAEKFSEAEILGFQEDFAAFDLDGSGAIDEKELTECFKDMNIEIDGMRLRKLLATVDEDGSGELEFDEFVELIDRVRNGKGFGLGDVFSGKARKLKKKNKKIKPASMAGGDNTQAAKRKKRLRHVFPKMGDWLFDHGLTRYENTFVHAGFRHTESLFLMKEEDMDTLGMKRGHKRKFMAGLKRLKKRERGEEDSAGGNGKKYVKFVGTGDGTTTSTRR
jgi:Ca2+-binding EF-hand superfamily protein